MKWPGVRDDVPAPHRSVGPSQPAAVVDDARFVTISCRLRANPRSIGRERSIEP
jgi:hypothetical protein